jgi:bifunctional DNA-binding transcriptional regulator/antitoxin component of YhaV-PrlF toxin-antitoxin module
MNQLQVKENADGELFFNIPDDVLERLGWEEGDGIEFEDQGDGFFLRRVKYDSVELDFDNEDLLKYMIFAHKQNITFNELCNRAIKEKLDEIDSE